MPFYQLNSEVINNPAIVKLNGIELPKDVIISIDGEKVLATSKIIDGVIVFEHISRNYYEINFETTVRAFSELYPNKYVFPEQDVTDIFQKIFIPDSVMKVENTLLNAIGIFEVVIDKVRMTTIRGNTDVPVNINCFENNNDNKKQTLIIS
jgi:hypothetical protein